MTGPPGGVRAGDLGVPTINTRKHQRRAPLRVLMGISERPPLVLRNIDGDPLAGADGDLRAPTISTKKHRRWGPWEVSELEIWERPPSMLRNVDDKPPDPCGGVQSPSRIRKVCCDLHRHDR
jgi:hypothetical protein